MSYICSLITSLDFILFFHEPSERFNVLKFSSFPSSRIISGVCSEEMKSVATLNRLPDPCVGQALWNAQEADLFSLRLSRFSATRPTRAACRIRFDLPFISAWSAPLQTEPDRCDVMFFRGFGPDRTRTSGSQTEMEEEIEYMCNEAETAASASVVLW